MLEFESVRKSYGANVVLDGLSFVVRPGEMFGFVGANGAGKTTTMRIALGLVNADGGVVRWREQPLDLQMRRRIGYMPEERGLYPKMRVVEQLAYFAQLHGMDKARATASAEGWVERLGVTYGPKDSLDKLSLGNQQKVQLAAALVHDPEILILDEPFSGLDPVGVDALAESLADRCRAGVPVIFSSHQLDLVERLCDSVGILAGGRLVADGNVEQLRQRESRRTLRVVVRGAPPGWLDAISGARVLSDHDGDVLVTLEDPSRDQDVLAAAQRVGRVEHFGWLTPTLAELFREAVAA
ncbi:MAG: ATP-binding cassette domain-containing protein [Geodermatophilaceae bacterium]|nr:ATP-binding cassette domain-containing protein [Geodermatophilaceae bacterium]